MKRMKKRLLSLFLSVLLAYSSVIPAFAAEGTATTMQLVKTEGTVSILTNTGKNVSVMDNMKLYSGYEVETGAKSYAWVNLDNTKLAKLDAASRASVRKRGKKLEILVDSGNIFFNITEPLKDDESLNIRTSTMSAGIRGTSGWVEVTDNNNVRVSVLEGTVEVSVTDPATGQAKTDAVSSGETAVCVVYEPDKEGDKCDILRESYDKEAISGFVLQEVVADTSLAEKIVEKGGLDLRDVTAEEVQTRLVVDEQKVEQKLEETAAAVETQEVRTVSEQTVWTAPAPVPTPQPSPEPPASRDTNTGDDTPAPAPVLPKPKPKMYTVTFDANGGIIADEKKTVQVQEGQTVSALSDSDVTRDEYKFTKWYTEADCKMEYDFSAAVTKSFTLYAGWEAEEPEPVTYEVTFDAQGGTAPAPQTVPEGDTATEPPLIMRFGHVFQGWYTNAEHTSEYKFDTAVTGDITLYAKWGISPYEGKTGALNWQYTPSTRTMTISGTGKMDDYNYDPTYGLKRSPWEGYWDKMASLEIGSGVTVIGDYAFFYCTALGNNIVIPDDVASIGRYAFAECSKMTSISIPASVTSIGDFAFAECSSLKDIYFGGTKNAWSSLISGSVSVLQRVPAQASGIHYGKYTVTFCVKDRQTDEEVATFTKIVDKNDSKVSQPSGGDIAVDRWYTDAECKSAWNFDVDRVMSDITLYAKCDSTARSSMTFGLRDKDPDAVPVGDMEGDEPDGKTSDVDTVESPDTDAPEESVEEPSDESEPSTEDEETPSADIGEPPVADIPENPVEEPTEEASGESGSDEAAESETEVTE